MKCKKHPKYQAKFSPRCDCEYCWAIWTLKNQPDNDKAEGQLLKDEGEKPYHGILSPGTREKMKKNEILPCDARAYADYFSTGGSDF